MFVVQGTKSEADNDAAYLIGSADPFFGWNAALDALLAARGSAPMAGSDGDRDARDPEFARLKAFHSSVIDIVGPMVDSDVLDVILENKRTAREHKDAIADANANVPSTSPNPKPDTRRRLSVSGEQLRKGDVILACNGMMWDPPHELLADSVRGERSVRAGWLIERTEPANVVPRSEAKSSHPDETLFVCAGMTKRMLPFPFKLTGTCAALARFMECVLANVDKDDQCNGDGEHHEWIDVTAAPRVADDLADCAALEW